MYEKQLDFYASPPIAFTKQKEEIASKILSLSVVSDLKTIPETFTVKDGVGVLKIEGLMIPKSDFFSLFFGGFAALDILTRDFLEMIKREDIHTIVLDIDSPGGNAFGVQQFANIIFNARSEKSIIAVTSGMMASAAMWIGAAAHKVFITGDVTITGSIGTVTTHTDISEFHKKIGIKQTDVAAGEYKRLPSMLEPLSKKGKEVLQGQVNHANKAFISDIAKFKNVKSSVVKSKMAEGKTFVGTQGIQVGLIDGLLTMDQLFSNTGSKESANVFLNKYKNNNFNNFNGGQKMSIAAQIAEMKSENPSLYDAIYKAGKDEAKIDHDKELATVKVQEYERGVESGKNDGIIEGAKKETERVAGIRELANAGNVELIEQFIADGTTQPPDAAIEILKAQKTGKSADLKNLADGSPAPLGTEIDDAENTDNKDKGMRQLVSEYMTEHKCTKGKAITACAKLYPDAKNDFTEVVKKKH